MSIVKDRWESPGNMSPPNIHSEIGGTTVNGKRNPITHGNESKHGAAWSPKEGRFVVLGCCGGLQLPLIKEAMGTRKPRCQARFRGEEGREVGMVSSGLRVL